GREPPEGLPVTSTVRPSGGSRPRSPVFPLPLTAPDRGARIQCPTVQCDSGNSAMPAHERPRLRPYLLPVHDSSDPGHVYLVDQLGLLPDPVPLPRRDFLPLLFLDGDRT